MCLESLGEAGDEPADSGQPAQVKEEEEEAEEQPAAKKKRGQSRSEIKPEKTPKEEVKSEGKTNISYILCVIISKTRVSSAKVPLILILT